MTLAEFRRTLLNELLFTATDDRCRDRVEKINELHRRLNAIDRYVAETPDGLETAIEPRVQACKKADKKS